MKMTNLPIALVALAMLDSCDKELVTYQKGDLKVAIEAGEGWLHDFPVFMGIKRKNPPQIAIWAEDADGRYLSTLYVTRRTATGSWIGGKDRPEALPVWSHLRGAESVDAATGATPKSGFAVMARAMEGRRQFTVKVEINHSADWNDAWPENSVAGALDSNRESGQPALVYAAEIDLDAPKTSYTATLIGHSSPDGTDGSIHSDTSSLTSALNIAKTITINVQ